MAEFPPKASKTKTSASKGEAVNIRVNPKTRFGLELLSRKQHRTLTSVIEWAVELALTDPNNGLWHNKSRGTFVVEPDFILEKVWDPSESDRFIKLAVHYPYLLSYEEEVLWKNIKEESLLWKSNWSAFVIEDRIAEQGWEFAQDYFRFDVFRAFWTDLKAMFEEKEDKNLVRQQMAQYISSQEHEKAQKAQKPHNSMPF